MTTETICHPARTKRSASGFTMIELLIVVVVAGTMMAVAVPKFRISPETEIQLAIMQLAQDVDLARTRALSTRSTVRIVFGTGARNYAGYLDDDSNGTIGETSAELYALRGFATRTLPVRINYGRGSASDAPNDAGGGNVTFAGGRVNFDSRGLAFPLGTGGTIYLQHDDKPSAVAALAISPAGAVRIWTWRNGAWQ